ncbi:hypothetical protein AB0I94_21870 [Streptomyces sp. NPDC050147]|uniref:hypothetical protein n=1 Tax=Streptomyces sp. NPDC050147 TaxID=3155513 RepID=UPI003446706B
MSEPTPSKAEGERETTDDEAGEPAENERTQPPRTTPSQAEGDKEQGEGGTDG